jgi:uncharacterized protein YneF (UPF0154 family)
MKFLKDLAIIVGLFAVIILLGANLGYWIAR